MDYELFAAALIFGAMFGAAGYRGLMVAFANLRSGKSPDKDTKQITVGEKHPELPAPSELPQDGFRIGGAKGKIDPYRTAAKNNEAAKKPDPFLSLKPEERFRRFVIATNDLGEAVSASDLEVMANALDLETLLEAVECDDLDTPQENAAVFAFRIRSNPRDEHALADKLLKTVYPEVCITVMRCLEGREPVNNHTISAVTTCAYGECKWEDDEDEEDADDGKKEDGLVRKRGRREPRLERLWCADDESDDDDDEGVAQPLSTEDAAEPEESSADRAVAMADDLLKTWKEAYPARMRDFVLNRKG